MVNSPRVLPERDSAPPGLKNGAGEDAAPPSNRRVAFHGGGLTIILLQIDSLRSPFGLPAAVFLRSDSALSRRSCNSVGGSSCLKVLLISKHTGASEAVHFDAAEEQWLRRTVEMDIAAFAVVHHDFLDARGVEQ